jgi:putative endonuclease
MTNDLVRRVYEHREGLVDGFTKQHGVKMLVYYVQHATTIAAIQREKNIKHWSRKWKIDLIRSLNPTGAICGRKSHSDLRDAAYRNSVWTAGSSPVVTRAKHSDILYLIPNNSTSNISVAFGGITLPAPCAP